MDTDSKKNKLEKKLPEEVSEECRSDPRRIESEYCPEPDQMCVSMSMDLTYYKGGSLFLLSPSKHKTFVYYLYNVEPTSCECKFNAILRVLI